ncbi:MAG: hypothetical protein ACE366_15025 [Bradymonadia bacterium]
MRSPTLRIATLALALLSLTACGDDSKSPDGANDALPPASDAMVSAPADMSVPMPDAMVPDLGPVDPVAIELTAPPRGQRDTGGVIQVEGRITGGREPVLLVDGVEARPEADGRFSVSVPARPGMNIVAVRGVDGDPNDPEAQADEERFAVLFDADVDPSEPVKDAATLMVGPSGLTSIGQVVAAYVESQDLPALLAEAMPGDLELTRFEYSALEVLLLPRNGYLELRFSIYGLQMEITGIAPVGDAELSITGEASVDPATLVARVVVGRTPEGGLELTLESAEASFENFMYDIENVPSSIEEWFEDFIPNLADGLIADAVDELVLPALFDGAALMRSVELLGQSIELTLGVQAATVDPTGLLLELDSRVLAEQVVNMGLAVRAEAGSPTMMDPSRSGDIDLAVATDLTSRILHAVWAAGILDLTLEEGGDINLPIPLRLSLFQAGLGEAAEGIDPSSNIKLRLRPPLPLVSRVEDGPRPLVIEAGDLFIDLLTENDEILVTIAAQFVVHMSVSITPGNGIEIVPELDVEAWLDVAETPRGPVDKARLEDQLGALVSALPGLLADTTFSLGDDVLPLPLSFPNAAVWADPEAPYVHLRADVAPGEPVEE